MRDPARNRRGFSLTETIVAIGIGATILGAVTSWQTMVTNETLNYHQKVQSAEFSRDLSKALDRSGVCGCNVAGLTITADPAPADPNRPQTYSAEFPADRKLYAVCPGGASPAVPIAQVGVALPGSGYATKVRRLSLAELTPLDGNWQTASQFVGLVQVEYESAGRRAIKPSSTYRSFTTAGGQVTGCGLSSRNVRIVASGVADNDAAETTPAIAECAADERVVGGGWYSLATAALRVGCTSPVYAEVLTNAAVDNAWHAVVRCHPVQAVAICMKNAN